ncbi:MAG: hypothetical protein F4Z06_02680 [Acidimicrobiia bacterium]|nr:hypothetical protein [Acidimicrobiia bacterium]MXZ85015.1 hypothetical protein [Acidimicrobiia bacterium]MYB11137.1 hypothetical protein [Acidimicrobiia bacterium]MYE71917.1 hypothetical protein [Acidimicrobiia bacterium]MYG60023.1 hypothetical protein [Acidimicrobiia bacterium]
MREFAGGLVPILSCRDLAVFKSFFDHGKDWQDIEDMVRVGAIDVVELAGELAELLCPNDHRVARVQGLRQEIE